MTAPQIANASIRRHSPGPSARPGRTCAEASFAAKLEARNYVDQQPPSPAPQIWEIRNPDDQLALRRVHLPFVSLVPSWFPLFRLFSSLLRLRESPSPTPPNWKFATVLTNIFRPTPHAHPIANLPLIDSRPSLRRLLQPP
jgi:hypothetical protein